MKVDVAFVLVNVQYAVKPKTYARGAQTSVGGARGVLCSEWLTLPGIPARVRR